MSHAGDLDKRPALVVCAIGSSRSCHIRERVKCFADRGHTVYLITDVASRIEGVNEIVPKRIPIPVLKGIFLLVNYFRAIRHCKADIVHVHHSQSFGGWMAAVVDHHPLVVSVIGGDILFEEQGNPTSHSRWLTLVLLRSADLITAKSGYLISVLQKLNGFASKAIKVMWGIDLSRFARVDATELRESLDISETESVILSPRLLQRFYNIHCIVEAMPLILAKHPDTKLVLTEYAADKAYKEEITGLINRLGLRERVSFVGEIEHEDMAGYYSISDVVVGVPPSDGIPQALLEAMACQVPNVVSRLPHYEEIVKHEESAYFVDISAKGIAEGVIRLLSDCELRDKIVRNGLQIVKSDADREVDVNRIEEQYYELLTKARGNRPRFIRGMILLRICLHYAWSHGLLPILSVIRGASRQVEQRRS